MKGPHEKNRDRIMALHSIGEGTVIMSLDAAMSADEIIIEEDPIKLLRLMAGMIDKFCSQKYEVKMYNDEVAESTEWYWKMIHKCRRVRILVYAGGSDVYIGDYGIRTTLSACEYIEKLYSSGNDYEMDSSFTIRQHSSKECASDYNGSIEYMGLVVERTKVLCTLPPTT